jgi:3-hydroxyacyl-[acyl-carrier-protein] dehydratase
VRVPEDYAWYAGHFPGYPIMAGVVQLHELVMPAVASVHPGLGELRSVTNVKFHKRIVPGDALELSLSWPDAAADGGLPFDFEIRRDAKVCAAGRLTYHPGATAS